MRFSEFRKRYFSRLSGKVALLLLGFLLTIGIFVGILHEVIAEQEQDFDLRVISQLEPFISAGRTVFLKAVTQTAEAGFLQVAYACLVVLYALRRDWLRCGEIAVIGIGGYAINFVMKLTFHRLRPPHPLMEPLHNYSFPSGHATSGFIFYGLLAYLAWKAHLPRAVKFTAAAALIGWALLVGFSRVYLRMHYASDVLAGFAIGASWLLLAILLMERQKQRVRRESATAGPSS
ncbi:phosphatase PAP2 family protein [Flaviaesturariibacter terrae]